MATWRVELTSGEVVFVECETPFLQEGYITFGEEDPSENYKANLIVGPGMLVKAQRTREGEGSA
jgi:hypothetical protein